LVIYLLRIRFETLHDLIAQVLGSCLSLDISFDLSFFLIFFTLLSLLKPLSSSESSIDLRFHSVELELIRLIAANMSSLVRLVLDRPALPPFFIRLHPFLDGLGQSDIVLALRFSFYLESFRRVFRLLDIFAALLLFSLGVTVSSDFFYVSLSAL